MEIENLGLSCKICQKKFSDSTAHLFHEKWHHQLEDLNSVTNQPNVHELIKPPSQDVLNATEKLTTDKITGNKFFLPNQCHICEKEFAWSDYVKRHIRTVHEGVKPHACQQCEKTFAHKELLRSHCMSFHDELKPHCCHVCEKRFNKAYRLKSHFKSKHECQICKEISDSKSSLKEHTRAVHNPSIPNQCQICQKKIFSSGSYEKTYHGCSRRAETL